MASKLFGISENQIVAGLGFSIDKTAEGLFMLQQELFCRYTDHGNPEIQRKLAKGKPITDFNDDPALANYDFLTLKTWKIEHQAGGITRILANFEGANEDDSDFGGGDDRNTSTSFSSVLKQESVLKHPKFLQNVSDNSQREAIALLWTGEAYTEYDDENIQWVLRLKAKPWEILKKFDDALPEDQRKTRWIRLIKQGHKFYDRPQIEWTVVYTNKGGMRQEDIDDFGLKLQGSTLVNGALVPEGDPPENPPVPSWKSGNLGWWQMTDLREDKDENSSTFSRTYTLRDDWIPVGDDFDAIDLLYARDPNDTGE